MFANLPQHDKLIAYCRQLLPQMRLSRIVNLGWVVLALLASTDSHLSSLAEVIPLAATELSLEQRLRRWLKNHAIDVRTWYEPFIKAALQAYGAPIIYVVMDSTQYGPGCRALVVGLAYAGQVLPLGWRVVKGKKGHSDPTLQNELLDEIRAYLPSGQVVLVADSEFCAVELLKPIRDWGWQVIVRVRGNVYLQPAQGQSFMLGRARLSSGQTRVWREVRWTQKHQFGPVMAIATGQPGETEPLYVMTNTHHSQAALLVYHWRFWIEPFFGDYKGRGFRLGLSRLRDPNRLSRLLLAASIAFLWA